MYRKIIWTIGLLLFLLAGCVTVTPTSTRRVPAAPTATACLRRPSSPRPPRPAHAR